MSQTPRKNDNTFSGVFLIGLAILFLTGWWWPGIMFVIGAAMIARAVGEGREWTSDRNALVVLGIGALFLVWDLLTDVIRFDLGGMWPIILIAVGVYLLFGRNLRPSAGGDAKRKHDDTI